MSEWDDAVAKLSKDDWKEVEDINSQIQSHTGAWGEIKGGEKDEAGRIQMPYADHNPLIYTFLDLWDDKNLIIQFDWSEWDEGREWFASTDNTKYDKLDQETALKLITAVIRNGRFNEGALLRGFEDGDLPKIINKFVSLRAK
jgi:hypothetical protein